MELRLNKFIEIPSSVYKLTNLESLDMSYNRNLASVGGEVQYMPRLQSLSVKGCKFLACPPKELCKEGLYAIRQYFEDMAEGVVKTLGCGVVTVIGRTLAGKTSLIRTLQSKENKRVLTHRGPDDSVDETTEVFNIEKVDFENCALRFIDMGGQEVYHLTYQLTLRENCIPVVVVNMAEYKQMREDESVGEPEAMSGLFFDWLAHLYLACPSLNAPKLVLTHKDKFSDADFYKLKKQFLATATSLRDKLLAESDLGVEGACAIDYLCNTEEPVVRPEDIFEVGNAENDYRVFDQLKRHLHHDCKQFVRYIPKSWEVVNQEIQNLKEPFTRFNELFKLLHAKHAIKEIQLEVILTYMHERGSLLWYNHVDILSSYIFNNIGDVTHLLKVLFNHMQESAWNRRLSSFQPFCVGEKEKIFKDQYQAFIESFQKTGVIERILLHRVFATETQFDTDAKIDVAVSLLKAFRLVLGPLVLQGAPSYIIPYLAGGYLNPVVSSRQGEEELVFRTELLFKGLALPEYVYHQMTCGLLELFPDETDTPIVKHNGATVFHGKSTIRLRHNVKAKKATIELFTDLGNIGAAWEHVIGIVNSTIQHTRRTWRAAKIICVSYCAHCLLKGDAHPQRAISPSWCILSNRWSDRLWKGMDSVVCDAEHNVPAALKFPCTYISIYFFLSFRIR